MIGHTKINIFIFQLIIMAVSSMAPANGMGQIPDITSTLSNKASDAIKDSLSTQHNEELDRTDYHKENMEKAKWQNEGEPVDWRHNQWGEGKHKGWKHHKHHRHHHWDKGRHKGWKHHKHHRHHHWDKGRHEGWKHQDNWEHGRKEGWGGLFPGY